MPGYTSNVTSSSERFRRLAEESEDWSIETHRKWRFQRANITQEVRLFPPTNSRFVGQEINVKLFLTTPYPREPPTIRFLNPVPNHPNITRRGELAEQTWSLAWDPRMGAVDVLEQLMTWLDDPDSHKIGNVAALGSDHRSREESRIRPSQGGVIIGRQGVANPFLTPEETGSRSPSIVASSAHDEDESLEPLVARGEDAKPRLDEGEGRSTVRRGGEWLLKGAKRFGQSLQGRSEHQRAQVLPPRGGEYPG
ncbi:hypothetical protein LTS09_010289 [Friedmanniomyces endolithicus]|nr:hypothetical protein LTS09_010289 [Friedmanniomyces endolithicus]